MTTKRNVAYWVLLLDCVGIAAAFALASYVHQYQSWRVVFSYSVLLQWWPALVAACAIWSILFSRMDLDGFRGGWNFPSMISQIILADALLAILLFALAFLGKFSFSRVVLAYFAVSALVGFVAVRCGMALLFRSHSRHGTMRRIVILGNGNVAYELARKIARHPELMCEVVGFLFPGNGDKPVHRADQTTSAATVSVPTVDVVKLLQSRNVDELFLALPDGSATELKKLVALCRKVRIGISLVPQWYELYLWKTQFAELDGLPMLSLVDKGPSRLDFAVKRTMDWVLGSIFLLLSIPLLIVAGAALYLRKGRGFTAEERCGKDGRQFRMYRLNVDRDTPDKLQGMERVLAQLSLTELPQLWNVLRGDMTLVGPRPESPDRVRHYSDWQRQRLAVIPGLTGLAQAHGLRDQHSSEEKARFDLQYIHQWSPFLDLSLVLQTCWTLAIRVFSPSHLATSAPDMPEAPPRPALDNPVSEVQYADRTHSCAD